MTSPCKETPQSYIDEEKQWLFAEIGRLSLQLRTAELQAHTLQAKLSDLEADGTIDHMGRKLPLPGHHKDCGHGKDGWSLCTCDKLRNRDARQFSELMNDIDASTLTTSHVAEPKCSKCGDTGRITIFGEGIATPTWCTACPKGRPSPLAESVTRAFQQSTADAVRTTLDRGGTVVGEVQGQWQVVSKTCDHGNTECKRCGVGQPTRDPRQDLKVGDRVRFELKGHIEERQSAGIIQDGDGKDFEPVQYLIRDEWHRRVHIIPYNEITLVIGKVKE